VHAPEPLAVPRAVASRFVTVFYGQLNADDTLRYCNAGHNAPFLVTSTELVRLEAGGTVSGLFDFSEYETGETKVSPGDLLVVFSDGLTRSGQHRRRRVRRRSPGRRSRNGSWRSAAEALAAVLKAVTEFAGTEPASERPHRHGLRLTTTQQPGLRHEPWTW
jgi:serine phosphatase RsbU (regulator of sigma subunit)